MTYSVSKNVNLIWIHGMQINSIKKYLFYHFNLRPYSNYNGRSDVTVDNRAYVDTTLFTLNYWLSVSSPTRLVSRPRIVEIVSCLLSTLFKVDTAYSQMRPQIIHPMRVSKFLLNRNCYHSS